MQEIGPDHEKVRFARTKLYATRRQIQRQGANGAQCRHGLHTVVDDGGVGRRMGRYEKSCITVWRANFSFFFEMYLLFTWRGRNQSRLGQIRADPPPNSRKGIHMLGTLTNYTTSVSKADLSCS